MRDEVIVTERSEIDSSEARLPGWWEAGLLPAKEDTKFLKCLCMQKMLTNRQVMDGFPNLKCYS